MLFRRESVLFISCLPPDVSFTYVSASSGSFKINLPSSMNPLESVMPAKVFVSTDLPDPDSPTMAMDSFS